MSTLFVVRHGQASFFEANYDRLSELGREQSRRLARYWIDQGLRFDVVIAGPRERQIDTAQIIGQVYQDERLPWPQVEVSPAFDEYQAEAVLKQALPTLMEQDEQIKSLYSAVEQAADQAQTLRAFQKVYELVISRWSRGELALADIEPWADFCARVQAGIDAVMARQQRGLRVAIFTSGGPVGVTLGRALQLSSQKTLEMAWMVYNAAYAEYAYDQQRFTLSRFNATPHLVHRDHLTYR